MRSKLPALAAVFVPFFIPIGATAQSVPSPGLRLFGSMTGTDVQLLDATGRFPHVWSSSYLPGHGVYLLPDGTLLRSINTVSKGNGAGGGVQRLAWDSTVLWEYHYDSGGVVSHHDIQPLPNGNVILIAWEDLTDLDAIALGRDPALVSGTLFRPDHLVEVHPTGPTSGQIVWQWHLIDHVIQDRHRMQRNFGDVAEHAELVDINYPPDPFQLDDWNHMNGIDYDPVHDWLVVSANRQNEIWIIDHSTSSQEAAGHSGGRWGKGGDLLYRWGNPAAYRAGTALDQQLNFQHDPEFIPAGRPGAGHLTIFNNRFQTDRSAVFEIALPIDPSGKFERSGKAPYGPDGPQWQFSTPGFFSPIISSAERLPNGNTLVCSGFQGWLFEVTPDARIVWQHQHSGMVFQAHYVEDSLWAQTPELSRATGGTLEFDLARGSSHGGEFFMLLGSARGTGVGFDLQGLHIPLDPDLLTFVLGLNASHGTLGVTAGPLTSLGTGHVQLSLPASFVPILFGRELDFACTFADSQTMNLLEVSNTTRVRIVP